MLTKLSSGTRKILEAFILSPEGEFHIRGLARETDLSPAFVSKALKMMESQGIVKHKAIANIKLYSISRNSPIYPEIKKILLKTTLLPNLIGEQMKKHNIKYALIFGSFASGKESNASDVDLLVIGDVSEDDLIRCIQSAERRAGRDINYILWNEKELRKRKKSGLLIDIAKKPIIMIIGEENEFRRLVKNKSY